jgi:hypothetical protein
MRVSREYVSATVIAVIRRGRFTRLVTYSFSFHVLVDSFQNQIRGLQIVLVLQDHVAISKDSKIRKIRHGRIAPASLIACTYCSQPANA